MSWWRRAFKQVYTLSKHPLAKVGTIYEGNHAAIEGVKMKRKRRMGRPKIEINWKVFDSYCALQCTLREISFVLGCSEDTIERRVREAHNMSFADYFARKRVAGLMSFRRSGWELAKRNPAVWIFCAKNWLGMVDKQEVVTSGNVKDVTKLSDEDIEKIISESGG